MNRRPVGAYARGSVLRGAAMMSVAAIACAAVAGCGSSGSSGGSGGGGSGSGSGPVKVLAIVDESGPSKAYGSQELLGLKAGAAYVNAHGGVDGRKVTIDTVDDGGSPSTATSRAVKALAGSPGKYAMVYPGSEGGETSALTPVLARYHVFAFGIDDGNSACATASKCPEEFVSNGEQTRPAAADARFLRAHGITKVGILEEQVSFTQSEIPPLQAALRRAGIAYTVSTFPESATSVTSEVSRLKSAGAQAMFAAAVGPPAGYALKARQALGWNADVVFDVAGSSLDITKLATSASQTKGAYETAPYCMDDRVSHPGLREMYRYAPATRTTNLPCDLSGAGWDAMYLLAAAAKQAGSVNDAALTRAAEHLSASAQSDPIQIVRHRTGFSPTNHENIDETPADFPIIPVGPIVGGQIKTR